MEENFEAYLVSFFRDKPRTKLVRLQWIGHFGEFCSELGLCLGQVTFKTIEKYQQRLTWTPNANGRSRSASTIDQGLREVRTFLRWAVLHGLLYPDPTVGWILPKSIIRVTLPSRILRI